MAYRSKLQNFSWSGVKFSHWERRLLKSSFRAEILINTVILQRPEIHDFTCEFIENQDFRTLHNTAAGRLLNPENFSYQWPSQLHQPSPKYFAKQEAVLLL